MLWLFYRVVMTYRIILTQGNNLSVENNVLGLWNCITYNLKVTSKRAYVHKKVKRWTWSNFTRKKYYQELGKTQHNGNRWWIYLHLCAINLFWEKYYMLISHSEGYWIWYIKDYEFLCTLYSKNYFQYSI